jgi:hypothetical protein
MLLILALEDDRAGLRMHLAQVYVALGVERHHQVALELWKRHFEEEGQA